MNHFPINQYRSIVKKFDCQGINRRGLLRAIRTALGFAIVRLGACASEFAPSNCIRRPRQSAGPARRGGSTASAHLRAHDILRPAGQICFQVGYHSLQQALPGLFGSPGYVRGDVTVGCFKQRIVGRGRLDA